MSEIPLLLLRHGVRRVALVPTGLPVDDVGYGRDLARRRDGPDESRGGPYHPSGRRVTLHDDTFGQRDTTLRRVTQ